MGDVTGGGEGAVCGLVAAVVGVSVVGEGAVVGVSVGAGDGVAGCADGGGCGRCRCCSWGGGGGEGDSYPGGL